ncbi:hypothetical protein [Lutibacter sp.]|uniref:hypothetical protein n=1 Tax=Lutibacter sp. TaxID=1925666 RepID=UPI001A2966CA|nr:hypothetical protein [Lutibacter sp.]MBI9041802.1 hypothetical protein [Lutibacter sp.]
MKKCNYIIIITLALFFVNCNFITAQQLSDENTYVINQYFQSNKELSSKLTEAKTLSTNSYQVQSNIVSLNQIGNNNEIDIKQKGIDAQKVNQLGNNNYYNFINYYNSTPSNFNITQQGNSNSLQIYGENSIIKNIGIIQKSDFNTLIIKNY